MKTETKPETKELLVVIFFAIIYGIISVAIASIAHEYYHAWSLRNVTYDGEIILNPKECGNDALFCYRYYVVSGKEVEYQRVLQFEETRAYALTFVIGFLISMALILLHFKITDNLCSRDKLLEDKKDKTLLKSKENQSSPYFFKEKEIK